MFLNGMNLEFSKTATLFFVVCEDKRYEERREGREEQMMHEDVRCASAAREKTKQQVRLR
jgi:hypothetical protein